MNQPRWKKKISQYESASQHYDEAYFLDQARHGNLRGLANNWKFLPYLDGAREILDFGCGDGSLLEAVGGKYGVEINPYAAEVARKKNLIIHSDLNEFDEDSFDAIISNHCLEHVENPLEELKKMRRSLKEGGTLVIVVPCHCAAFGYREADRDYHLFSWSAANLGNIVKLAGFEILECKELRHRWPPKWPVIIETFGLNTFHVLSRIWGRVSTRSTQVRCVARVGRKTP